jgi:PBP1b-binding outer membrane lipoprotein LpoB
MDMKTFRMIALLLALAILAGACSQNHYAKTKRKVTHEKKEAEPRG